MQENGVHQFSRMLKGGNKKKILHAATQLSQEFYDRCTAERIFSILSTSNFRRVKRYIYRLDFPSPTRNIEKSRANPIRRNTV